MTEEENDLFSNSLTRCVSNPKFLERFYELFMNSSDEVREKFKHTDWQKQQRMLKASFHMLMLSANALPEGQTHLERIAARHSHADLDIPPDMYDLWIAALILAVSEYDPKFSEETERVWRLVMNRGITYMKDRY